MRLDSFWLRSLLNSVHSESFDTSASFVRSPPCFGFLFSISHKTIQTLHNRFVPNFICPIFISFGSFSQNFAFSPSLVFLPTFFSRKPYNSLCFYLFWKCIYSTSWERQREGENEGANCVCEAIYKIRFVFRLLAYAWITFSRKLFPWYFVHLCASHSTIRIRHPPATLCCFKMGRSSVLATTNNNNDSNQMNVKKRHFRCSFAIVQKVKVKVGPHPSTSNWNRSTWTHKV